MAYATTTYVLIALAAAAAAGTAYSADASRRSANISADIAADDARAAQMKARFEEDAHRQRVKKIISSQRALYGASGVSMEGSPLLVMEDTAAQGELDALAIRYGGEIESARKRSESSLLKMRARDIQTAGYISTGSSLLSGASSAYGNEMKFRK